MKEYGSWWKTQHFIQFSIIDTGSGIDEKYHRQIFDRYFQVPGEHQNGTGLGLAISKTLLRNRMVKLG
jgi:signal transduction histidine kinase